MRRWRAHGIAACACVRAVMKRVAPSPCARACTPACVHSPAASYTPAVMKRVAREVRDMTSGKTPLPLMPAASVFLRYDQDQMHKMRALVTGEDRWAPAKRLLMSRAWSSGSGARLRALALQVVWGSHLRSLKERQGLPSCAPDHARAPVHHARRPRGHAVRVWLLLLRPALPPGLPQHAHARAVRDHRRGEQKRRRRASGRVQQR